MAGATLMPPAEALATPSEANPRSTYSCPECGDSPQPIARLELTFGFRVVGPEDLPHEFPYATAVCVDLPEPGSPSRLAVE